MTPSTCEQIGDELVAFLDGELGEGERRPIASHVATCLVCRREIDRLTAVRGLLAKIPRIEPGPEFAARFWQRMEAEPQAARSRVRSLRSLRWVIPALAAAAVLAIGLSSVIRAPSGPTSPTTRDTRVVQAPPAEKVRAAAANDEAPQLADVDAMRPEDLPPALLEHPELFLRLPVVRHLETLQHFDAVRQESGDPGGAG